MKIIKKLKKVELKNNNKYVLKYVKKPYISEQKQ